MIKWWKSLKEDEKHGVIFVIIVAYLIAVNLMEVF